MSIASTRQIAVCNNTHLIVGTHGEGSSSKLTLAPLDSIILGLALLSESEGKLYRRAIRKPTFLQTLERPRETCQSVQKLQGNQFHTVTLPDDAKLTISKMGIDSGTYLVIHETWNTVRYYLEVSNAAGYVVALNGVLFVPTLDRDHPSDRHYLSCCAQNSLWTNGTEILNNDGVIFVKRIDHNGLKPEEDTHCIKLESKCEEMKEIAQPSSWRTIIGKELQSCVRQDENQYQQSQIRLLRREYLKRETLSVLNEFEREDQEE